MVIIESINRADTRLLLWCGKSHHYPLFVRTVRSISRSGDGYLQCIVPFLFWWFYPVEGLAFLRHCAIAFLIERALYLTLKPSLKRRRPPEVLPAFSSLIQASDRFSFPSGHSMAAFLLVTLIVLHFGSAFVVLYLWSVSIACSRVLLGVHFPTDVMAGASLGLSIAYLTL